MNKPWKIKDKLQSLQILYSQVHTCKKCYYIANGNIKPDTEKVPRKLFPHILKSELFLIGQSLASNQVRVSGISFHDRHGIMSKGGRFLEKYLNGIGYTLSPTDQNHQLIYSSDIVQCYPGKKEEGTGDNIPTKEESVNCRDWILQEMELVDCKIILLLGKSSTQSFFEYFMGEKVGNISDYYLKEIIFTHNSKNIVVFVLPHSSSMVKGKGEIYEKTFSLIQQKL